MENGGKATARGGKTGISGGKGVRGRLRMLPLWLAAVAGLLFFLLRPAESAEAVRSGLRLCYESVVPALFPYFVLASLIIESGLAGAAGRFCERPFRALFGLPGACAPAFFLGVLSGYPVGARAARAVYERGGCSKDECERLLAFCNNTGPGFLLGTVGAGVFGSARIGALLYGCHLLSAVLTGLLMRPRKEKRGAARTVAKGQCAASADAPTPETRRAAPGASGVFTEAVRSSALSVFYVVAFIVLFAVILRMLETARVLPALAALLGRLPGLSAERALPLLRGLFEVTGGCVSLADGTLPFAFRLAAASGVCGWAGLCVHAQVLCVLEGSGLSSRRYLAGKALQGAIAFLLGLGAAALFSPALAAFAPAVPTVDALRPPYAALAATARMLLIWGAAALLLRFLERRRARKKAVRRGLTNGGR